MSDSVQALFHTILAKVNETDKKLADFSSKLDKIPEVLRVLAEHSESIAATELSIAQLRDEIQAGRESPVTSTIPNSAENIITGLPVSATDSSKVLVQKVFLALEIPELTYNVLSIRDITKKPVTNGNVTADNGVGVSLRQNNSNQTVIIRRSVIVALKSCEIRNHIIRILRSKREVTAAAVFSSLNRNRTYVNELLLSVTYNFLRHIKLIAKQAPYRYV